MSARRLKVNGHSATWLRQGFQWVYPNEVVGARPPMGTEVLLEGPDGKVLGRGIADDGWIAARVYRFADAAGQVGPLDVAWLDEVLDDALALRDAVAFRPDTDCGRLVHGENDGLPGLRVDRWGDWLTLVLDTPSVAPLLPLLVAALEARRAPRGIWLCWRPDPRDTRPASTFRPAASWIAGGPPDGGEVVVSERGIALHARPGEGPDVGVYADMREVRAWLSDHWAGTRVLNTFAFTGAFSVAAALAGAAEVVSVDLSGVALDRARANFRLNGLDDTTSEFLAEDTFRVLDRLRRTGRRFDRVVVDPPSFSHGADGMWSAKKDLPRLVSQAARVVAPGGWLVLASNQGQVSPREFRGLVADGLKRADRRGRELMFFGAAPDYPASVAFPEGHYLKVGVWALDGVAAGLAIR